MRWFRRGPFWVLMSLIFMLIVRTYGGCEFKSDWSGRWFISGVQNLLTINSTWIESKGTCLENSNDKYMIYYATEDCFRCMVIHEKHRNVLQYKETYCDKRESLDNLCNQIPGDATLYSMFRVEPRVDPVPCPFKGPPFTFTYSRGLGECGNPPSRVDSCTDDSRLSFKYQACPDVQGTESTVEELQCLAQWKDGSTRYLVGKLSHHRVSTDEDAYRCFVWERSVSHDPHRVTYNLAQSGDATCNGLTSATEGSKTIKLTKVENTHTRCKYAPWITDHHRWHTLDHSKTYHFFHKNATLKITSESAAGLHQRVGLSSLLSSSSSLPPSSFSAAGSQKLSEMRVVCHAEVLTTPNKSVVSAHVTYGCESGYLCMTFYRRDANVIELQQSKNLVQLSEDACSSNNFDPEHLPFTTLITTSLPQRQCPHAGRYTVAGQRVEPPSPLSSHHLNKRSEEDATKHRVSKRSSLNTSSGGGPTGGVAAGGNGDRPTNCDNERFESVTIGCASGVGDGINGIGSSSGTMGGNDVAVDTMVFASACHPEMNSAYSCYGSWEENGTHYLIASPVARKSTDARRYCFVTRPVYATTPLAHTSTAGSKMASRTLAVTSGGGVGNGGVGGGGDGMGDAGGQIERVIARLMVSSVANTCDRALSPGLMGTRAFNLTLVGQCSNSQADRGNNMAVPSLLVCVTLITLLYGSR